MKFTALFSNFNLQRRLNTHNPLVADVVHERLIALGGMGIAVTISAVAYVEAQKNNGAAAINGADHLAVFAKPALYHEERIRVAERATEPSPSLFDPIGRPPGAAGVDYEATASIAPAPTPPAPANPSSSNPAAARLQRENEGRKSQPEPSKKRSGSPYLLQSVSEYFVVFRNAEGKLMARAGESVPGVGRIAAITKRNGHWVAVITKEQKSGAALRPN